MSSGTPGRSVSLRSKLRVLATARVLPAALPRFETSAGVVVGAALEKTAQAMVARREMIRKEGIVIERTWVLNERGLAKVVQVRRLRKLRRLSMGFPAKPASYLYPQNP